MISASYFVVFLLTTFGKGSALNLSNLLDVALNTVVTETPSSSPSASPSMAPSHSPTSWPSTSPSLTPTSLPSDTPTEIPTLVPSSGPTSQPSSLPTLFPSPIPTGLPSSGPSTLPTSPPSSSPTDKHSFSMELSIRLYRSTPAIVGCDSEILSSAIKDFASQCVPGKLLDIDEVEINSHLEGTVHVAEIKLQGRSPYTIRDAVKGMVVDCFDEQYANFLLSIDQATEEVKNAEGSEKFTTSQIIYTLSGIFGGLFVASAIFLISRRKRHNAVIKGAETALRELHLDGDKFSSSLPRCGSDMGSLDGSNVTFPSALCNIGEEGQKRDPEFGISFDEDDGNEAHLYSSHASLQSSFDAAGNIPMAHSAMEFAQNVPDSVVKSHRVPEISNLRSMDTNAIEQTCKSRLNCCYNGNERTTRKKRDQMRAYNSAFDNSESFRSSKESVDEVYDDEQREERSQVDGSINYYPSMARVLRHKMSAENDSGRETNESSLSGNDGILFQSMGLDEQDLKEDGKYQDGHESLAVDNYKDTDEWVDNEMGRVQTRRAQESPGDNYGETDEWVDNETRGEQTRRVQTLNDEWDGHSNWLV